MTLIKEKYLPIETSKKTQMLELVDRDFRGY